MVVVIDDKVLNFVSKVRCQKGRNACISKEQMAWFGHTKLSDAFNMEELGMKFLYRDNGSRNQVVKMPSFKIRG